MPGRARASTGRLPREVDGSLTATRRGNVRLRDTPTKGIRRSDFLASPESPRSSEMPGPMLMVVVGSRPPVADNSGRFVVMAAKFEIYEDARGEFRFRLKAGNGEIVATGEGYATKDGAKKGVDAVKRAAAEAGIVEV